MGSGSSQLTKEQCKQRVPEDKWDESWDEFYFADGKTVSTEIAERVWCKAERWAAYILAQVVAEPKDNGVDERDGSEAEDAPTKPATTTFKGTSTPTYAPSFASAPMP